MNDDPLYRAPEDAIVSWQELAESARAELERIGFAASVVDARSPDSLPDGAYVWVHEQEPFGVSLDWSPPVTRSPRFREIVIMQDMTAPLFQYVVNTKEIIQKAMLDILKEAGFRTLVDHQERDRYLYRVLAAPAHPVG